MLDFTSIELRSTVESPNYGGTMTIVGTSYPIGTTLDEIERRVVRPEFVMLSADGRHWIDGWHRADRHGPESDDAVYVERHTLGGCVFHGWVDAVSRRVVQTG